MRGCGAIAIAAALAAGGGVLLAGCEVFPLVGGMAQNFEYQKLVEVHAQYPGLEGKKVAVLVSTDYAVLYDSSGDVGRAYGAKTTPHMIVVDKDGKVAYNGAIDEGAMSGGKNNYVDAALVALAAGKTPDPSTTKPYGCSVKY